MAKKTRKRKTTKKKSAARKRPATASRKTAKRAAAKRKTKKTKTKTTKRTPKKTVRKATMRKTTTKKTTAVKAAKKRSQKKAVKKKASTAKKRASAQKTARYPRNPLTKAQIGHFRQLLLEKRAELIGDVSLIESEALKKSRLDAAGDLSSMPIHMADIGTDNFEQEFALGLMSGERKILIEIEAALQRIHDGRYGICEGTGKPIGKKRLDAIPWARYSMEYAQMVEKGLVIEGERVGGYEGWESTTGSTDDQDVDDVDLDEDDEDDVDPFDFLNDEDDDEDY